MLKPNESSVWQAIDAIEVSEGKITLPLNAPAKPGLYRLKFDDNTYYVGQAKVISRRFGDYHTPGQGIESDHRIHNALRKFGRATVEVITGDEFADSTFRHKREAEEVAALRTIGKRLLNGNPDSVQNLQDRIEYYQSEIEKLQTKIAKLTSQIEGGSHAD
jgi:hypothetical protein